jgi:glutamate 5-kinase
VLSILDASGREFARGMSNYGSENARLLIGKESREVAALAGANHPEFITRDNIALKA